MAHEANITEIFQSLQGEGPYTGESTLFVRFSSCSLGCAWCDTQNALCEQRTCRVHSPNGLDIADDENPVTATRLNKLLDPFAARMLSVTGGEPLEQTAFLAEWLPSIHHRFTVLLETNGVMWKRLTEVLPFVHAVGMDFKLPSSTGQKPLWSDHENFLRTTVASGTEVYVKIVVTEKTSDKDVQEAIRIISKVNKYIPVFVQPAAQTLTFHDVISRQRLDSIDRVISAYLPNVQVAQQMHKEWGVQ